MGSPLAPVLANLFMGYNEKNWIKDYTFNKPNFYKRYVDDILACFDDESDANQFFNYLNNQHNNITFTMEKQKDNTIPFLDTHIKNIDNKITISTYHKTTFTGLLLNFSSFTSLSYKISLVKCLIDRAFKINNTWKGFHIDLTNITNILVNNSYPIYIINKNIKEYLDRKHKTSTETNKNDKLVTYFKLPYLGKFSKQASIKIKNMIKQYCKEELTIKIVFTSFKIKNYFSYKTKTPFNLNSFLVYKFVCAGCGSSYIGETTRHIKTRIGGHVKKDKNSHIYKHLHSKEECFNALTNNCFNILDRATNRYNLNIKEALHIKWENPNLNAQLNHFNLSLIL